MYIILFKIQNDSDNSYEKRSIVCVNKRALLNQYAMLSTNNEVYDIHIYKAKEVSCL
jgi:hypothetical protein